ncbi:HvfC/BufC family peptide modification chaperone [Vibrio sinaloensis]|uniref:HvfC/BufC family peptide modification chaperone n=1 Tax=Photobacterium sp. (strain ATCC 43367) TaxID=379097 RepID=UPI0035EC891B
MHEPPTSLVSECESLTTLIRSPFGASSLCRYSQFIRNNVINVLNYSFPMFCKQLSDEALKQLVDDFVVVHYAAEPEFHHIATEFVKYIQIRTTSILSDGSLTSDLVSLLEFEWYAFFVEIDPMPSVNNEYAFSAMAQDMTGFRVSTNKTMKLINVPFIVHKNSVTFLTDRRFPVYYALYRDEKHEVVSLKLREIDVAIIQMITLKSHQSVSDIQRQVAQQVAGFNFTDWIQHFSKVGLLSVELIGQKL